MHDPLYGTIKASGMTALVGLMINRLIICAEMIRFFLRVGSSSFITHNRALCRFGYVNYKKGEIKC